MLYKKKILFDIKHKRKDGATISLNWNWKCKQCTGM